MRFEFCSCCSSCINTDQDPDFFGPEGDGPLLCEGCRNDEPLRAADYEDYLAQEADSKRGERT